MAGPPTDVKPSALWAKLSEAPAPSEVVDFPRYEDGKSVGRIRIEALTGEAIELCRKRALDWAREVHGWDSGEKQEQPVAKEIIADAIAREILCRACHEADPDGETQDGSPRYVKLFPSPDSLKKLRPDEVVVLFQYYNMAQAKFGPIIARLDEQQLRAWVQRLQEGGSAFPLALLDSQVRDNLTLSLAQKLCTWSRVVSGLLKESPELWTSLPEELRDGISYFGSLPSESPSIENGLDEVELTMEDASALIQRGRVGA